jgi:phage terminase large subunit
MQKVSVQIPIKFKPLLTEKKRYKLYHGGRAGGKSYAFADCLLLLARQKNIFVACVREIQGSIKDSVYKLLKDRTEYYGFGDFEFYEDKIINIITGSKFVFKGLRDQNRQNIKSLEGVDYCWVEEGQSISKLSWEILDPTIRKPDSEIWVSMNREQENDPIFKAIAKNPDDRTLVCKVNYYDNPFCPEEMKYLAEKCKKENPDDYEHIWLGCPVQTGNTKLISAKDVRNAMEKKMLESTSPLVIGVDVARFGDDKSVICWRRGRMCSKIQSYSQLSTVELANLLTKEIKESHPSRVFIDVGGVGAGVYDILVDRGYREVVRDVNFGGKALYDDRYYNKRAEMWGEANDWLKQDLPVELPNDEELFDDLCSVNKKYDSKGRLQLESKDEVKKNIGRSPDKADAFVLTFAYPVLDNGKISLYGNNKGITFETLFADAKTGGNEW